MFILAVGPGKDMLLKDYTVNYRGNMSISGGGRVAPLLCSLILLKRQWYPQTST